MKLWLPALLAGAALSLPAQAPNKIAIIHLQNAIIGTKDGQKAAKELETKFMPKRQEIERRQGEIQALQQQLRASSNTASEEQKNKLMRDIDAKQKSLQRDGEDASAELDQEQQKLFQEIGGKVMAVIDKFATDNGYAVVIDVSAQSSPVLYASTAVDITRQVVETFDKNAPAAGGAAAPAAPSPAKPKPAPVK
ncbi:MAG TPA: OmpH family outer membrane protein [Bryobacteraceae bacterium]|nr:OmpH family outer membrane protein [Bryobacteraceae bacterium]